MAAHHGLAHGETTRTARPARRRVLWTDRTAGLGPEMDALRAARREARPEGIEHNYAADRAAVNRVVFRLDVMGAIPGVRLAADAGEWMTAVQAEPVGRSDFQRVAEAVAQAMAAATHQEAAVVRLRHAVIAERATALTGIPVSVRQVARTLKRLDALGLVICLAAGRAADPAEGTGPVVPMYALMIPERLDDVLPDRTPGGRGLSMKARNERRDTRVRKALGILPDESGHLDRPAETTSQEYGQDQGAGMWEETALSRRPVDGSGHRNLAQVDGGNSPLPPKPSKRRRPASRRPAATGPSGVRPPRSRRGEISKTQQERYAARLLVAGIGRHMVLSRISSGRLARLLAPLAVAGWSPTDVLHALDFLPDGSQHIATERVRHPWSWAAWRLSHWLPGGEVMPSRTQAIHPGTTWTPADPGRDVHGDRVTGDPSRPWTLRYEELQPEEGPVFADPRAEVRRHIEAGRARSEALRAQRQAELDRLDELFRPSGPDMFRAQAEAEEAARMARERELFGDEEPVRRHWTPAVSYGPAPLTFTDRDATDAEALVALTADQ
ncbi:hypothetical protein ACIPRL_08180 [Streptomyces sp. NPDC090085]|uniref:hypothetical protein n=1 Tax=Streptomyces sp. NPDC090085 TaxID=3365943 RepID=UPI0038143E07